MFFKTENGWVNATFVVEIREVTANRGVGIERKLIFIGNKGEELGRYNNSPLDFEPMNSMETVIPAAPDAKVTSILVDDGPDGNPTETHVGYLPIIAWRVTAEYARPILMEECAGNETWLIELPDGRLCSLDDCTYDNLDAAREDILDRAQKLEAHRKFQNDINRPRLPQS